MPGITGSSFNIGAAGARSTEAAYAELVIPVVRTVEAQVALRDDHYSDFGSTINPKVALRWQPLQALLLRASYGHGFRAPALNELFTQQPDQATTIADPVRCPVTNATADCSDTVAVRANGNPALKPERSEQWSAGFVVAPNEHVSASVDFWRIRLTNSIGILQPTTILADDTAYEGINIVRGPVDPSTPSLPGRIVALLEPDENLGITKRRGIDVEAAWRSDPTSVGRFTAHLEATYMQEAIIQPATTDYVDQRAVYLGIPRWQHDASVGWDVGAWAATLRDTMQSGFSDAKVGSNGVARHVGVYDIWRAQLAWSGIKDTKITLGVDNLFDGPPPASNQSDFFQTGYVPSVADPRGRFWYLRLGARYR